MIINPIPQQSLMSILRIQQESYSNRFLMNLSFRILIHLGSPHESRKIPRTQCMC